LGQLQDVQDSLKDLGYQLVFISPDRPQEVKKAAQEKKYDYLLLSDSMADAAKAFGVAWHVEESMRNRLMGLGIDLEKASGEAHFNLPVPSVFIFDRKGIARFTYVDPDYHSRIAPDLLLAAAQAVK
jgi:peroxiredoxin